MKIKCIKDKDGSLIPIDKISYISKDYWVFADNTRHDINYETLELLRGMFEEVNKVNSIQEEPATSTVWYDNMDDLIADAMLCEINKSDSLKDLKNNRINWIKKHRNKPAEWSEEDKKLINDTCHLINTLASGYGEKVTEPITLSGTQMIASIKDRLRALVDNRPQSTWKPSRKQMNVLKSAISELDTYDDSLVELYNDLKKLREE